MKLGIRTPSVKKRISSRTTGRVSRSYKRTVTPMYGKAGYAKHPRRAIYNAAYTRTTRPMGKGFGIILIILFIILLLVWIF